MSWQIHAVVEQPQNIDVCPSHTEHHKVAPRTPLPRDMQGPNAWLDVIAFSGTWNIRSVLQSLDRTRHRFSVVAGPVRTEGLGRPLQDFNVVLFRLLSEPNRPNLPHTPAMALDAKDAK
jgi:hypothetical protein